MISDHSTFNRPHSVRSIFGPAPSTFGPLASLVLLLVAACATPEKPLVLPDDVELRLVEDAAGRPVAVDATGLGDQLLDRLRRAPWGVEEWSQIFTVAGAEGTPLAGDYRVLAETVRFVPGSPFTHRTKYVVTWKDLDENELAFEPSRDGAAPTTQVFSIYPSADLLPQNLARLHIEFTAPMTRGRAGEHLSILPEGGFEPLDLLASEDGDVVETWSEDGRRLTLALARDAEGKPVLQIAARYRLVVDRGWQDAEGVPLRDTFEKVFAVSKNDREPPDPTSWEVTPPVSAGAPLTVDFPAPLDRFALEGALAVLSQDESLDGRVRISNEERRWLFSPEKPWSDGRYVVKIVGELEDPAGNVLGGGQTASAGAGTVVPFLVELPEPPKRRGRRGE